MKVFISWSGETSRNIAEIFRQWIPSVIQVVKPYYSPDDIAKGTRWSSEIAKELDESKVGIICLTKDNLSSSWIMFEAGALSKNIDQSKVCPILFGVEPSDIQGPLVQFQAARFTKEEVKKVSRMINQELGESALEVEVFENVFEMWWPTLEKQVNDELNKATKVNDKELRSERELLEEVLSLSRTLVITKESSRDRGVEPAAIDDLVRSVRSIIAAVVEQDYRELSFIIPELKRPLTHVIRKSGMNLSKIAELQSKVDDTFGRFESFLSSGFLDDEEMEQKRRLRNSPSRIVNSNGS